MNKLSLKFFLVTVSLECEIKGHIDINIPVFSVYSHSLSKPFVLVLIVSYMFSY